MPESAVDRKVHRILTLAARVGALEGFEPTPTDPGHREDGTTFARKAAMVLVRNDKALPPDPVTVREPAADRPPPGRQPRPTCPCWT